MNWHRKYPESGSESTEIDGNFISSWEVFITDGITEGHDHTVIASKDIFLYTVEMLTDL